jgi:hypothetical protein
VVGQRKLVKRDRQNGYHVLRNRKTAEQVLQEGLLIFDVVLRLKHDMGD